MIVETITLALLGLIGFTALRTSVCMVAAAREIVRKRRANRLTGFLFAAGCATLAMAASRWTGCDPFAMIPGYPASFAAAIGGALFALGAAVNGRCALGTMAALASGEIRHLATLGGMIATALACMPIVQVLMAGMAGPPAEPSLLDGRSSWAIALGAGVVVVALGGILRRTLRHAPAPRLWSPIAAMALIGAASGTLFALDQQWSYTSFLTAIAAGRTGDAQAHGIHVAMLALGMVVGAASAGLLRLRSDSARRWLGSLCGGMLMGLGATFVPGGNDAMLMTGVPLLLPNLLVAYTSLIGVLLAIESWRFGRERAVAQSALLRTPGGLAAQP